MNHQRLIARYFTLQLIFIYENILLIFLSFFVQKFSHKFCVGWEKRKLWKNISMKMCIIKSILFASDNDGNMGFEKHVKMLAREKFYAHGLCFVN